VVFTQAHLLFYGVQLSNHKPPGHWAIEYKYDSPPLNSIGTTLGAESSPLPLSVAKTSRNNLKEKINPLLHTEPVYVNVYGAKESIPRNIQPTYVA
jgi:hypothetical protein